MPPKRRLTPKYVTSTHRKATMQTIILIDNQLVTDSVVQIWFRKKGVYLVTNRTEN